MESRSLRCSGFSIVIMIMIMMIMHVVLSLSMSLPPGRESYSKDHVYCVACLGFYLAAHARGLHPGALF